MKGKLYIVFMMAFLCLSFASGARLSELSVTLLDYSPNPVQPGQVMDVNIQISNLGNPTENSQVEIIEEFPFILENTHDLERAKNLGTVISTQTLLFRIKIDESAKDGVFPLTVRYKNNEADSAWVERSFDINVETFDARIDVYAIEQSPEKLIPGETGKLILKIKNNDDKPLKNIDVVLDLTNTYDVNSNMDNILAMQSMINARLEEINRRVASGLSPLTGATPMMSGGSGKERIDTEFDVIATVGSSNQKLINFLAPQESIEVEFEIVSLPDAMPNIYAVPLYVNYNDEDNNPFHIRSDIPIIVDMPPELYVELSSSTLRTTDFSGIVEFTVANRGLSDLNYLTLDLEENEDITILTAPKSIYVGNLAPGESFKGQFNIIAEEEEITLPLKVSYRDSFNKEFVETIDVEHIIRNKNYYRDLPYEMWLAWLILGVVVLVLTIFYVKNINKRKE